MIFEVDFDRAKTSLLEMATDLGRLCRLRKMRKTLKPSSALKLGLKTFRKARYSPPGPPALPDRDTACGAQKESPLCFCSQGVLGALEQSV